MTASVRRPSLRRRLALGTALTGGTLAFAALGAGLGAAQTLPTGGTVILPSGGTVEVRIGNGPSTANNPVLPLNGSTALPIVTTQGVPTINTLDIGLKAKATVINWTSFSVQGVDAAHPANVNFRQAAPGTDGAVVVNRVVGVGQSNIANGSITTYATIGEASTRSNTSVWLLNPNGVLIGGGGAVNAGAFLASTLDLCATPLCSDAVPGTDPRGAANLTALTNGTAVSLFSPTAMAPMVTLESGSAITTGGSLVVVGGQVDVQAGSSLTAAGEVNLVAATDITLSRPGSPIVFKIDRGSSVPGLLVNTGGNVRGDSVVIAAARPDGFAGQLLNLAGTVTATGVSVGARGIILLGGTGATESDPVGNDPTPFAGRGVIELAAGNKGTGAMVSTAALTAFRGGDVTVNGTGDVSISGDVLATGRYLATGRTLTLGDAATPSNQVAYGSLTARTTSGPLQGRGALTLQSNGDGADGEALTLASGGAIDFDASTKLLGGVDATGRNSVIRLLEAANTTATNLGTVRGYSVGGISTVAGARPPLTLYGATTLGTVNVERGLTLTIASGGGATPGTLTSGIITAGQVGGAAAATVDDIAIATANTARLAGLSSLTGSVSIAAADGDVTGLASAGGFLPLNISAAPANAAATVAVYAGRDAAGGLTASGNDGLARLGVVTAGGGITVRAQAIDASRTQANAGAVDLRAYAVDASVPGTVEALAVGTSVSATPTYLTSVNGSVRAGSVTAGGANAGSVTVNADRNARLGSVASANGSVVVTARDGDVTGLSDGAGGFGSATLAAARAQAGAGIADGNVAVYAGRDTAGTQTATGINGLALLESVSAGGNVSVDAQKIAAGTVQAGAISGDPLAAGAPSGTVALHAYAHDAASTAVDLRVASASAGTGNAARPGLDTSLVADAAGGRILAGALNADRDVLVNADGAATVIGAVRAGRLDTIGAYRVSAGAVTLGLDGATVLQQAPGAVVIRSTATDIVGLGALTLQANTDGTGLEALTLDAARGIALAGTTSLFGGNSSAAGNSDILVSESTTAAATSFGTIRARSFRSPGSDALTLYGATTLGTVNLDRGLALTITDGGGSPGTLTSGPITTGRNATAAADIAITTASTARLDPVASLSGNILVQARDGDVTGRTPGSRANLTAATVGIDGAVTVYAGRDGAGTQTATGSNGLARLGTVTAGGTITVAAQAIDTATAIAQRGAVQLRAYAADGAITGGADESLALGTGSSGLQTTLDNTGGSIRATSVDAGLTAVRGTNSGFVRVDAFQDARLGAVNSRLDDVTVSAHHGDIIGSVAGGAANLSAQDGNVVVVADAQALGAAQVGSVRLGTVFAQTQEALAGTNTAPTRGNISVVGRVVSVGTAETARFAGGATVANSGGGSLRLQAREGTAADDVHVTLGTGLAGTTATLTAASGSLGTANDPNGTVTVGTLVAGRDGVVGNGAGSVLAGNILVQADNNVRAGTITSRTGNVTLAAINGDVTGLSGGLLTATAAQAQAASGGNPAVLDGTLSITAQSALANRGIARLGQTLAGGNVQVTARAIDAAGQSARSLAGSVTYAATAGNLTLGIASAAADVLLSAAADTQALSNRGPGNLTLATATAGRNIEASAAASAAVVNDIAAGTSGAGHYYVTGGNVVLGNGAGAVSQGASDDVRVVSSGDITGNRQLTLRSNSFGRFDGTGAAAGTRGLTVDAGGTVDFALPDGLTLLQRDALAARLIGGTDASPLLSVVSVRGAAGTTMTLGNVQARSLRAVGATSVATDYSDLAALAGTNPLFHSGTVRIGSATTGETLGIFAYGAGSPSIQIDNATSITGNVVLVTSGSLQGYQLAPASFVATNLSAPVGGIYTRSGTALLGTVQAFNGVGLTTTAGELRADTVNTTATVGSAGIQLAGQTDLRLTSADAASGSIVAQALNGDVTGLTGGNVSSIVARDGNVSVAALGTGATNGLVRVAAITARSTELIGAAAPARGNVDVTGRDLALGSATAGLGTLTLTARQGGATAADTALVLTNGSAGTSATILVNAGTLSAASDGNGTARIASLTTGTNAQSGGATAIAGNAQVSAAGNVRADVVESRTGGITLTARDGDVSGLTAGTRTTLTAARSQAAAGASPAIADGSVAVYAGRTGTGALTATSGTANGLALLGVVTAGADVTVGAQRIDARTVQAAAAGGSDRPATGSVTFHSYAHGASGIDLLVGTANAGTGAPGRAGADVTLIADAAGGAGVLSATTLNADRTVSVTGNGGASTAAVTGEVRAGRVNGAGTYQVSAGSVTLGAPDGSAVEQSSRGGVAIGSTGGDIVGLARLTLESNSDGTGGEPLTVQARGAIRFDPLSHVFGGTGTAAGSADIEIAEGAGASVTTFGEIRGRSLGGIPQGAATAPVPLTLYGATTLGTVNVDRSLTLTVDTGGAVGTLTAGPITVGVNPVVGTADNLTITTAGTANLVATESRTGAVSVTTGQSLLATDAITARDAVALRASRDVGTTTVTSTAGGVSITAIAGNATGQSVFANGGDIGVIAGGRAAYAQLGAAGAIGVTAGTIGVGTAGAGSAISMIANGADGSTAGSEALVLGTGTAGTTIGLNAQTGSIRTATLTGGTVRNGTPGTLTLTADRNVRIGTGTSNTGNVVVTARQGNVTGLVPNPGADFGRAELVAAVATPAQGGNAAITDGNVEVYAGRNTAGAETATGANGAALLGTLTAGNGVTVVARSIDLTRAAAGQAAGSTPNASVTLDSTGFTTARTLLASGSIGATAGTALIDTAITTNGGIALLATGADAADEALVLGNAFAGTTASLEAQAGSVRATGITGGTARNGTPGTVTVTAARNVRVGAGTSNTGNLIVTARDGNVTGLPNPGGFDRTNLTAASAAPAQGGNAAIADGNLEIYAGRNTAGAATGTSGSVLLGTGSAGNSVKVVALALDVTRAAAGLSAGSTPNATVTIDTTGLTNAQTLLASGTIGVTAGTATIDTATATNGAIAMLANGADGATPGSEALVLDTGSAGTTVSLAATNGSVRASAVTSGTNTAGAAGDLTATAARNVRLGTAFANTGTITLTARDGDVTGLSAGRADLTAASAAGNVAVYAGRDTAGAVTATGTNGTALLGPVVAGNNITVVARAIDVTTASAGGTGTTGSILLDASNLARAGTLTAANAIGILAGTANIDTATARTGAISALVSGTDAADEALVLVNGTAGTTIGLETQTGSIRATTLTGGTNRNGALGTVMLTAARNVRAGTVTSNTGNVVITARNGDVTGLATGAGFGRADLTAAVATPAQGANVAIGDGNVEVYAGRDTAGAITGAPGLAQLGTVSAGNSVKLVARTIDVTRVAAGQAAGSTPNASVMLDSTGLTTAGTLIASGSAGVVTGTADIATATATNGALSVGANGADGPNEALVLGTGSAGTTIGLEALNGSVRATTLTGGTAASATPGTVTVTAARAARIGTATANTGNIVATARDGNVEGLAGGRADLNAAGAAGNVEVYAGRDTTGALTGMTANATALLGTVKAGNSIKVVARAIDVTTATAGGAGTTGVITLDSSGLTTAATLTSTGSVGVVAGTATVDSATAANGTLNVRTTGADAAGEALVIRSGIAGAALGLDSQGGSIRATTLTSGQVGTGNTTLTAANDIRLGDATAILGDVIATARDGEITGLAGTDRANLFAASAAGNIEVYAGRDTTGAATGTTGLARLGTVTAGNNIKVVALTTDITTANAGGSGTTGFITIDSTGFTTGETLTSTGSIGVVTGTADIGTATAINGSLDIIASGADGTHEALVLGTGSAGTAIGLNSQAGSVRATTLTSGQVGTGNTTLTAANNVRLGDATATIGNVVVTARDGEITGLAGTDRANISAESAPGNIEVYAGRDTTGAPTGTAGLARLGSVTAGNSIRVIALAADIATATAGGTGTTGVIALDSTGLTTGGTLTSTGSIDVVTGTADIDTAAATNGALGVRANGTGGTTAGNEALILRNGSAGTTIGLDAQTGSIRATTLTSGRVASGTTTLTAANNIRLGMATANVGDVVVTARDGQITGLGGTDRADISAANASGNVAVYAGRDMTGASTGTVGLAQLGTVTAGNSITVLAKAIDVTSAAAGGTGTTGVITLDATGLTTGGTLTSAGSIGIVTDTANLGTATATNGALSVRATGGDAAREALVLGTGSAGTTIGLDAQAGSIRATTLTSGTADPGTMTLTAANNVRLGDATANSGNLIVTARNGEVTGLAVTDGANLAAANAAGNVEVYAGRDTTGVSTGNTGLVRLAAVTAGNSVKVVAKAIEVTSASAGGTGTTGTVTLDSSGSAAAGSLGSTGSIGITTSTANITSATAANGAISILATGADPAGGEALVLGTGSAGTTIGLTAQAGSIRAATLTSGQMGSGTITLTAANNVRLGDATANSGNVIVTARDGEVTGLAGSNGAKLTAAGATGNVEVDAGRDTTGASSGTAGLARLNTVSAGGNVKVLAKTIEVASATAGGTGTAGTVTLDSTDAATAGSLTASSDVGVTALGTATVTGPVSAGARNAAGGYTVTAASVVLGTAGTTATAQGAKGATTVIATNGGVTGLGTLTLQSNSDGTGGEALTVGATNGNVAFDATTTLNSGGSKALVTARGANTASVTVGAVTAAGNSAVLKAIDRVRTTGAITAQTVTVQSSRISLLASVNATTVGLYNQSATANQTSLGGAAGDTDGETGFALSQAEFDRITTPTLLIGSGTDDTSGEAFLVTPIKQNVTIGALKLGTGTGSTALKVLGTGDNLISVVGALDAIGVAGRTLQLGGAATGTSGEIARIDIANDTSPLPTSSNVGSTKAGSIKTDGTLDLRGGAVLAGTSGFIAEVRGNSTNVARDFVANPNSSLYGAGVKLNGYLTPVDLVVTSRLRVQFSNFALFQNTGRAGLQTLGVRITGQPSSALDQQPLVLRSGTATQANAFALFGSFEPAGGTQKFTGTQTALLGSTFISNGAVPDSGVNPSSARANGCLIGSSSGGCLATSIAQPLLNVFDVTRDQVLRGSDNLVVTFDPLVGSNNEALFGDIAAGDFPFDQDTCPDGTISVQCKVSGEQK